MGDFLGSAFGAKLPPYVLHVSRYSRHCLSSLKTRVIEDNGSCEIEDSRMSLLQRSHARATTTLGLRAQIASRSSPAYSLDICRLKHHQTVYTYCTNDQALPFNLQQMMARASGVDIQIYSCTAGHSPFSGQRSAILDTVKELLM